MLLFRLAAEEDAAHGAVKGTGHGSGDRTHDRSAEHTQGGRRRNRMQRPEDGSVPGPWAKKSLI